MALRYNVDDWYWQVGADSQVWSSARFAYVDPTTDAQYIAWLDMGGILTQISTPNELGAIMSEQRITDYLSTGLSVIFTSNDSLSATYALDSLTLDQVGTLARDIACGFGFPTG